MRSLFENDSVAQQVEHIPFKDGVLGSSPSWITTFQKTTKTEDSVAQQVEHIPFKDGVLGSSPSWITNKKAYRYLSIGFSVLRLYLFLQF